MERIKEQAFYRSLTNEELINEAKRSGNLLALEIRERLERITIQTRSMYTFFVFEFLADEEE